MATHPDMSAGIGRPRLPGLVLVLLLHLLAAWLLIAQLRRPATAPPSKASPITVSLPRLPEARMPPIRQAAPARLQQDRREPRRQDPLSEDDGRPPTPPALNSITPGADPAPLNLALPTRPASAPERERNPALGDPRANTARLDADARMAATLGSDLRLYEENLGDGRHRFRQGGKCVETREQRIQQLDPYNASTSVAPRLVGACN